MDRDEMKKIIREVIEELSNKKMLNISVLAYSEISEILFEHYREKPKPKITKILEELKGDPYIEIIHDYFGRGWTIESIAEMYGVEPSTISRNKKRLCLEIYRRCDPSE